MFKVEHISKTYESSAGRRTPLQDISFSAQRGSVTCVLGESGTGKSTLLRILAGIEKTNTGEVIFDTPDIRLGYVSQSYTLWPHLTVRENLTLAPSLAKQKMVTELDKEANKLLKRFGLEGYGNSYPHELSGGQRQRVALLRAVMHKPDLLLLDEVTSSLDPELTKSVLDLVRALAKDGYTMVVVTHHLSFAMSVADKVLFLHDGKVAADQNTVDFFSNQTNRKIRSFITDLAKKDEDIEVFKGVEQFQAYHLGLMKRLEAGTTIHVAGAVGDTWHTQMGVFNEHYQEMRTEKGIIWQMVTYEQGDKDRELVQKFPHLNNFRKMSREIQNPANYNVFGDTVITQIFGEEPTIIQVRNQKIADAYMRFFEELWEAST
jgi:polar amino acid transport system ATP-binding protein